MNWKAKNPAVMDSQIVILVIIRIKICKITDEPPQKKNKKLIYKSMYV